MLTLTLEPSDVQDNLADDDVYFELARTSPIIATTRHGALTYSDVATRPLALDNAHDALWARLQDVAFLATLNNDCKVSER